MNSNSAQCRQFVFLSMIAVLLLTFFVLLGIWTLQFWWKNKRFFQLAAKIPQIEGHLPLIGHGHKLIGVDNKGNQLKLYFQLLKFIIKSDARCSDVLLCKGTVTQKALARTSTDYNA